MRCAILRTTRRDHSPCGSLDKSVQHKRHGETNLADDSSIDAQQLTGTKTVMLLGSACRACESYGRSNGEDKALACH